MKKLLLLFTILSITSIIFAQVSKTVNLATAGTLSTSLISDELNTVTNLTITGTIDARDFKTMRDKMPLLAVLDLSGVTIAAYSGTEGTSWNTNYAANVVPENAFINPTTLQGKISLISVVLPSSVTSIGDSAFRFCSGLTAIAIPSSVTSIGNLAFQSCSGLITVDSNNPNYSGLDGVLYNKAQTILIQCPISKMGSFTIPSSVTSIGDGAFLSCSGLTSITIPSSVASIGGGAFSFCSGLTTIAIPFSVTSIGNGAFAFCSGLTTVVIPSSVTSIGNSAFLSCKGMTTVTIPSSVTSIGNGAFNYCSGLTSIAIPSSVTLIGNNAFANCSGLTSITTSKITPLDLGSSTNVFSQINKTTCTLYVPVGSKSAYQVADQWKDFKNIVEKNITGLSSEINNQTLSIYPNPTKGKVKILFAQVPEKGTILTVNDFTGKTILTQLIQNKEEQIDLGGNSPGVYFITTHMKGFKVQKIILK